MKVLFLSYSFNNSYPAGIASFRIADALADSGVDIYIVSSDNCGRQFQKGGHIICSSFPNRPSRMFTMIGRLLKRNINNLFWEIRAYSVAKNLISQWRPDVIYARATPVAVCAVAAKLSKKFHIPTVMHFTDPWPSPVAWLPNINDRVIFTKWMEQILPYSTLVSFGNQRMLEYQQKIIKYRFIEKAFVSPDPTPNIAFTYCPKKTDNVYRLVYLGKIHGSRNPQPLFDVVTALNDEGENIELIICDKNEGYEVNPSCIKYIGRTTNVKELLLSADIQIDIDGDDSDSVFISSKFKDYINYGRPILSITPNNSPIRELVDGMHTIVCVRNEVELIKSAIKSFQQKVFHEEDYSERMELRSRFIPQNIVADLIKRISQIISK